MSPDIETSPRIVFAALETFSLVGGLQNFNRRVIANLSARTLEKQLPKPRILLLRDRDSVPADLSFIAKGYSSRWSYLVRSVVASLSADIFIIGHVNLLPLAAMIRCVRWKLPILLFVHGDEVWNDPSQRKKRWYESFLIHAVNRIASVSNYTARVMSREFGVPTEKFSLLPNAVDPIAPLPPRTAGPPTVLTVTRLDRRDRDKNVTQMIDAIGILKSRVPNVRYEIVGAGSLLDELRARAEERGLSDTVVFHGRVSPAHLDEAYRRATVFALPSSKEGFGIVYLEAWLRELPVICSCFGASHEIVSDQEDGFVVDSRSPEEIAERLFQLLSAPPLAQKFGESGRRKVEKMYLNRSFRKNLDRLVDDTIGQSVKT